MSDHEFQEMEEKYNDANELLDIAKNVPLSSKLDYCDQVQMKDKDLVYGIVPSDFYIRIRLN